MKKIPPFEMIFFDNGDNCINRLLPCYAIYRFLLQFLLQYHVIYSTREFLLGVRLRELKNKETVQVSAMSSSCHNDHLREWVNTDFVW